MRGSRPHDRERCLRRHRTEAEHVLWQRLRDRRLLDRKFRRQRRIGRFVADFVCLEARLIVEVDGSQHLDRAAYDDARTRWLETQGFRVIRFWNDDVLLRMDDVLTAITAALAAPHPPFGHPLPACGEREKQTGDASRVPHHRSAFSRLRGEGRFGVMTETAIQPSRRLAGISFSPPAGRRWPKAG